FLRLCWLLQVSFSYNCLEPIDFVSYLVVPSSLATDHGNSTSTAKPTQHPPAQHHDSHNRTYYEKILERYFKQAEEILQQLHSNQSIETEILHRMHRNLTFSVSETMTLASHAFQQL